MAVDFLQIRQQIQQLGQIFLTREKFLEKQRELAQALLQSYTDCGEDLRQKIVRITNSSDPSLHCAFPLGERLTQRTGLPMLPPGVTALAADGSQIDLDPHAEVEYCLINVGTIQMCYGTDQPPMTRVHTQLFYDRELEHMTENILALKRDLNERKELAELGARMPRPVVAFTDGPMELWRAKVTSKEYHSEYQRSLEEYFAVLESLADLGVIAAGYVDKPGAGLVTRLLEIAFIKPEDEKNPQNYHPLRGVRDQDLFEALLQPGERSAVYSIQSSSAKDYPPRLKVNFFYINVGREGASWLARVEAPEWVINDQPMLDTLHAVLVDQCRRMGNQPYPYLLHRAHETAVVQQEEKAQITQMILLELRNRGVRQGKQSHKSSSKLLAGRKRYS